MNGKRIVLGMVIGLAVVLGGDQSWSAAKSPEEMKLQTERMELEKTKQQALRQCERFKGANQENYDRCTSSLLGRYQAEIDLLMRDPDTYFARKESRKNTAVQGNKPVVYKKTK